MGRGNPGRNKSGMEKTMYPDSLKYSQNHFWVKADGKRARIGITDYYCKQLQSIVFVELPEEGAALIKGQPFGSIESSKAISDVESPVSGKVTAVNTDIAEKGEAIAKDPCGAGWFFELELANPAELDSLLSSKAYEAYVAGLPK